MRLLIIVGNKVFVTDNHSAFLIYEKNDQEYSRWIKSQYSLEVIKSEEHLSYNATIVYAISCGNLVRGHLLSIAATVKRLEENEPDLAKYLHDLQAKLLIKLQYGIRDGKVIAISEISKEERGLKCRCTCPGCGLPLQAKLGERNQPHFAHNNAHCDIASAQQTALHMLAKEIIEEEKRLLLPALTVERSDFDFRDRYGDLIYNLPLSLTYLKQGVAKCKSVTLEKKISDIVPDIIVEIGGKTCLVEIAVTHFIDEEKQAKIDKIGLAVLEIDLSDLYGGTLDREAIRKAVLLNADNRRWAFNPKKAEAIQWAKEKYEKQLDDLQEAAAIEQEKYEKKAEAKEARRKESAKNLHELFKPENYKCAIEKNRNDHFADSIIKDCCFYRQEGITPFFVDIPITGEMIFQCDRRAWQSRIFDKFIYNRKDQNAEIHIKKIEKWATDYQHEFKVNWLLASKTDVVIGQHHRCVTLLYDVIKQYLMYLYDLGFLSGLIYSGAFVKAVHTISAPNSENAVRLQAILKAIDLCDPDIDTTINHLLHPEQSACFYNAFGISNKPDIPPINTVIHAHERKLAYEEIKDLDFDSNEMIVDSCGKRWLLCTSCGRLCREDEMASYGGISTVNKGTCKKCKEKYNECEDIS